MTAFLDFSSTFNTRILKKPLLPWSKSNSKKLSPGLGEKQTSDHYDPQRHVLPRYPQHWLTTGLCVKPPSVHSADVQLLDETLQLSHSQVRAHRSSETHHQHVQLHSAHWRSSCRSDHQLQVPVHTSNNLTFACQHFLSGQEGTSVSPD